MGKQIADWLADRFSDKTLYLAVKFSRGFLIAVMVLLSWTVLRYSWELLRAPLFREQLREPLWWYMLVIAGNAVMLYRSHTVLNETKELIADIDREMKRDGDDDRPDS